MLNAEVSVIIPTYNREKIIIDSVQSILAQTVLPREIIVVDDASTDGTVDVLERLNNPLIKIHRCSRNYGAQHARNVGIRLAVSDWIMFNDSDDFWVEDKIEIQIKELAKLNFDANVVLYSGMLLKENGGELRYDSYKISNSENPLRELLIGGSLLFQSLLVSKKALEKIGYLDEDVPSYQEWETSIRLATECRFVHIDKPLFIWNRHGGETISGNLDKVISGYKYVLNKHRSLFMKAGSSVWLRHIFIIALYYLKYNKLEDGMLFIKESYLEKKNFFAGLIIILSKFNVPPRTVNIMLRCALRWQNLKLGLSNFLTRIGLFCRNR